MRRSRAVMASSASVCARARMHCGGAIADPKVGGRVKADRRDVASLVKLHRAGELTAAWVPGPRQRRFVIWCGSVAVRTLRRARQFARRYLPAAGSCSRSPRLQGTLHIRVGGRRAAAEIEALHDAPVADDHRLQHRAPAICAVHLPAFRAHRSISPS